MPLTTFDPAHNGFAFANSWVLSEQQRDELRQQISESVARALPLISSPVPGAFLFLRLAPRLVSALGHAVPDGYGLCGGMAFASLDYWYQSGNGSLAARFAARPAVGSDLHAYLWRRLIESLVANGHVFLAWMCVLHFVPSAPPFRGGAPRLLQNTRAEWRKLRDRIDAGQPVPLGLIGETRDPFSNHQVLAYGYESMGEDRGRIDVYDMNCPGAGRRIGLDLRGPILSADEDCAGGRGRLRGFFCETYLPVSPP